MSWEYRVISTETLSEETLFTICEVYYDKNGRIEAWSDAMEPIGVDSLEDLKGDLKNMRAALNLPVIPKSELNVGKERL